MFIVLGYGYVFLIFVIVFFLLKGYIFMCVVNNICGFFFWDFNCLCYFCICMLVCINICSYKEGI